jgi:nucleoside-diphosphate-sugar epimerase
MSNSQTALVTGVAGFVGSAVARCFLDAGLTVIGVDALRPVYDVGVKRDNLRTLLDRPGFTFLEHDLAHDPLAELVGGVDVISHQAGRAGLRDSWDGDFGEYLRDNVGATQRLLDAVLEAPRIRRVVLASSSSVYGDAAAFPTREDALPAPLSPYGVSKLAAEHLGTAYARAHGLPVVALRYFTVFGPGQRPDMAFSKMVAAVTGGPAFPLLGDGGQVRDFTFVGDIAAANLACLDADLPPGTVLNVAGGTQVRLCDALDVLGDIAGRPVPVERHPAGRGEARRTSGDVTAARELLGWAPEVGLRAGLQAQYDAAVGERVG